MFFGWLGELVEKGFEKLRVLILRQTDKRWFIVLVMILAVVGICVMLVNMLSENIFGILKVAAAVVVAIILIKKMKL